MCKCFPSVYVCAPYVHGACGRQEKALGPQELELYIGRDEPADVGARKQTGVLRKNLQCSSLLSHLFSPQPYFNSHCIQ